MLWVMWQCLEFRKRHILFFRFFFFIAATIHSTCNYRKEKQNANKTVGWRKVTICLSMDFLAESIRALYRDWWIDSQSFLSQGIIFLRLLRTNHCLLSYEDNSYISTLWKGYSRICPKGSTCKFTILHLYAPAFTLWFPSSDGHAGLKGQHVRMNIKLKVWTVSGEIRFCKLKILLQAAGPQS